MVTVINNISNSGISDLNRLDLWVSLCWIENTALRDDQVFVWVTVYYMVSQFNI